jgi:hypothetical protein
MFPTINHSHSRVVADEMDPRGIPSPAPVRYKRDYPIAPVSDCSVQYRSSCRKKKLQVKSRVAGTHQALTASGSPGRLDLVLDPLNWNRNSSLGEQTGEAVK